MQLRTLLFTCSVRYAGIQCNEPNDMGLPVARSWSFRQSTASAFTCCPFGMYYSPVPWIRSYFFQAVRFPARTRVKSGISSTAPSAVNSIRLAAADVASGAVDVINWLVFLEQDPQFVGRVREIVEIGRLQDYHDGSGVPYSYLLKVLETRGQRDPQLQCKQIELLVPLVDEFVKSIDLKRKRLLISPPEGLLELASRPDALRKLRPLILDFCRQQLQGLSSCLKKRLSSIPGDPQEYPGNSMESCQYAYMPTRRQLHAAGRQDLIESIMYAGGFPSVAQDLKLPTRRRPNGFWDDLGNLDAELEWFINDCWVKTADPTSGRVVYVSKVTKLISLEKPPRRSVSNPSPVSDLRDDIGTAIMPRERTLKEAGRYDLHHAIALHGGYKAVAKALGRQSVPLSPSKNRTKKYPVLTLEALEEEIQRFMENKGLSYFPSFAELKSAQRNDLVAALNRHGGLGVVADHIGIRPKRYGKRHWSSFEEAAAVLHAYLVQQLRDDEATRTQIHVSEHDQTRTGGVKARGRLSVPTESQLIRDGRPDLRYVIRKYGEQELAMYLDIGCRKGRRSN